MEAASEPHGSDQGPELAILRQHESCEDGQQPSTSLHKCFLIVHSVAKRANVGNLLRSATAFGVAEVFLIGSRQFSTFGSHGAVDYVNIKTSPTLAECCRHLREQEGCRILGVEIMDGAASIMTHPFHGPTAFILGNEGEGLSDAQIRHCDGFVYIPQHGPGTASLNVYVAASIVLHHFASWAGYGERSRTGGKFDVGERPRRTSRRGMVPLTPEEMEAEKARRQAKRDAGALSDLQKGATSNGEPAGLIEV